MDQDIIRPLTGTEPLIDRVVSLFSSSYYRRHFIDLIAFYKRFLTVSDLLFTGNKNNIRNLWSILKSFH